ncbi:Streptothricin hydrolase [Mycena sanguinolenta]|uniref:Streptothricin hydrolase n=1 Tax=Mycena sanguinolenta TaxID=230812 RepID=A0A8H6ZAU7_9AGAR|nr:Streptothricin hydrolase [Mycena sanguinolenta]
MPTATMSPHRVLLVLNMQVGLAADPPRGIPAAATVRANVARVLQHARMAVPQERAPRIVHMRNCGEAGGPDEEGTSEWELLDAPQDGEFLIDKRKGNAFDGTELGEIVPVDAEVVVVGVMSEYSVKSTCRAALQRGNTVLLISGAHGTYDHKELTEHRRFTPAHQISAQVEEELDKAGAIVLDMSYVPGLFDDR